MLFILLIVRKFIKAPFSLPMRYFTIFNKKGFVLYEQGNVPSFLNNLVSAINPNTPTFSKRIRDDIMECEIRDQIVYLSINRAPVLAELVEKYEKMVHSLRENEILTSEAVEKYEKELAEKSTSAGKSGSVTMDNESDDLNYGETSSVIHAIAERVKEVSVKRAFNLFTGKIDINVLSKKVTDHLISKNVDPSFCKIITDNVMAEFHSKEIEQVSEKEFKEAMADTLRKTIASVDHDRLLKTIKDHQGVYTICFVGVNGVGKSTSLAKVACWLLMNGLKVYIAACDTFRAGAVEQLKVHVDRFHMGGHNVGFYESGYSKDDASVAKSAIIKAKNENYDVVLIDTAGRMHNKEHLMQSLNRLIKTNMPDHIIFVGEALVGGDSLSHIREFNKWISDGNTGCKIDSILLTKIDTVDTKIGQVLNLSFSASAPIIFLGTGQANNDLIPADPVQISDYLTG